MSVDSSRSVRLAERYVLLERIAVGGMGEVHLATDERLGRRVAVKVLAPVYSDSPDFVERFRREALTAAGLAHPNIAQVYDYGVDGSAHFIVMEHVDGSDLARLLRERGRMTPSDAVRVAEQVCGALATAHRAGVVHRDIKPGNVMVRRDGTVKVTDFGIAQARGLAPLTETGTVMGTAAYVAPEQARGQATSPASDLYSLGILLFQMLTGAVPFEGDNPVTVAMRHLDEPVPSPSSRVAGLPAELDEVVARATAKSPADRYPDADAMAAALRGREHLADAATRALPVAAATSVLEPLDAPPPGARTAVRAPAESTSVMTSRPAGEPRRRSGPSPLVWGLGAVVVCLVAALVFALVTRSSPSSGSQAGPGPTGRPSASAPGPSSPAPTTAPPSDGSTVPADLVGRGRDAAVADLNARGNSVRWVLVRSAQPNDTVLGSYPAPGQPLAKGQTVALVVSRADAPDRVNSAFVVPDGLVGRSAADAVQAVDAEGVRVTRVTIPTGAPDGQVVATWPSAGRPTTDGVVVLVVSGASGGSSDTVDKPSGKPGDKPGQKPADKPGDKKKGG